LPYHNPLIVADRISQLDHQLRGRLMFGVGAGSLPSDVHMLGIDQSTSRPRTGEALDVIIALLEGQVVTKKTDWFDLRDARCHLQCYTRPYPEIAVASAGTPSGPSTAGKYGAGVLSLGVSASRGFGALSVTWDAWSGAAKEHGREVDRSRWRLAGPVHIAETREQARKNVQYGIKSWLHYANNLTPGRIDVPEDADFDTAIDAFVATGAPIIGTPDDLIERIEKLWEHSGGFGCWLDMQLHLADFEATKHSYELIALYVMPHFSGANRRRQECLSWAVSNHAKFIGDRKAAEAAAFKKWEARGTG
jgi:limonene 1,2-monooxygenase